MKSLPEIVLKPGEEQRILSGHPWIFDNEIASFPESFNNGSLAFVKTSGGFFAGMGYANTLAGAIRSNSCPLRAGL